MHEDSRSRRVSTTNKKANVRDLFGAKFRYCVMKAGLQHSLCLDNDDKDKFCANVTELVEAIREATIKSQLFATHYILHWTETKGQTSPAFFTQNFFLQKYATSLRVKHLFGRQRGKSRLSIGWYGGKSSKSIKHSIQTLSFMGQYICTHLFRGRSLQLL